MTGHAYQYIDPPQAFIHNGCIKDGTFDSGHDERIEVESVRLTTGLYLDLCEDFLG